MGVKSYERLHDRIQDGDIIFVRSGGEFIHNIISFFTESPHIHVGIAFWMTIHNTRQLMIVEANGFTCRRILNLSEYKHYDMDVISTGLEWMDVSTKALKDIGYINYGWFHACYIGISEFFERVFNRMLPRLEFTDDEICSKFVADCIGYAGNTVSPSRLYTELIKLGYKRTLTIR